MTLKTAFYLIAGSCLALILLRCVGALGGDFPWYWTLAPAWGPVAAVLAFLVASLAFVLVIAVVLLAFLAILTITLVALIFLVFLIAELLS